MNRVVQYMKYVGGTFLGHKAVLCTSEIMVVGHRCTYDGRKPEIDRVGVIKDSHGSLPGCTHTRPTGSCHLDHSTHHPHPHPGATGPRSCGYGLQVIHGSLQAKSKKL